MASRQVRKTSSKKKSQTDRVTSLSSLGQANTLAKIAKTESWQKRFGNCNAFLLSKQLLSEADIF